MRKCFKKEVYFHGIVADFVSCLSLDLVSGVYSPLCSPKPMITNNHLEQLFLIRFPPNLRWVLRKTCRKDIYGGKQFFSATEMWFHLWLSTLNTGFEWAMWAVHSIHPGVPWAFGGQVQVQVHRFFIFS